LTAGGVVGIAPVVRGDTAREVLKLDWAFPVYKNPKQTVELAQSGTFVAERLRALPRDEAFRFVAGDDTRPLLVMRECGFCKGSNDALLSTRFDNDKTVLLSQWFHVVKLPNHVLEDDHPFRNLFDDDKPAHLFVATADGSSAFPLSGQQSQTELWNAMTEVLEDVYTDDPQDRIQGMYKILDRLDQLDQADERLHGKFSDELEKRGPKSSKLKKIRKNIDELKSDRNALLAELAELRNLEPAEA
jgi:hypothetical protein